MKTIPSFSGTQTWTFSRRGGIFQAQLDTVGDLRALSALDPKLWVALSCPVNDLEIDRRTLSLIDNDADDRVRIGRFIGEKIEKWAVTRDKAMQQQMETGVESVSGETNTAAEQRNGPGIGGMAAMVAAGGIAIGALGAGLAQLFNTMKALTSQYLCD